MKQVSQRVLLMMLVGLLAACISGKPHPDTYTSKNGATTVIQSDREMCESSCNEDYSRCMESRSAGDNNSGIHGPSGMFGASADCRSSLQKCLPPCKAAQ
jgi:hypothetical protein